MVESFFVCCVTTVFSGVFTGGVFSGEAFTGCFTTGFVRAGCCFTTGGGVALGFTVDMIDEKFPIILEHLRKGMTRQDVIQAVMR